MKKCLLCKQDCKNKYCNNICSSKHKKIKIIENYWNNPNICLYCYNIIPLKDGVRISEIRKKKFCNHSCSASHNNKGVCRNKKTYKILKLYKNSKKATLKKVGEHFKCLVCQKKLLSNQSMHCSNKCFQIRMWNKRKKAIKENPNKFKSRIIKKLILEERGNECEVCNWKEWMGQKIPIELDHIDGNHKNQNFDNVRLICPNCHAQTSTYKNKNKGNGRHFRRKRYKEGKSY